MQNLSSFITCSFPKLRPPPSSLPPFLLLLLWKQIQPLSRQVKQSSSQPVNHSKLRHRSLAAKVFTSKALPLICPSVQTRFAKECQTVQIVQTSVMQALRRSHRKRICPTCWGVALSVESSRVRACIKDGQEIMKLVNTRLQSMNSGVNISRS